MAMAMKPVPAMREPALTSFLLVVTVGAATPVASGMVTEPPRVVPDLILAIAAFRLSAVKLSEADCAATAWAFEATDVKVPTMARRAATQLDEMEHPVK